MKPRLLSVLGARPQFIKAAPLIHAILADGRFQHEVLHTGQHFDANMSSIFFDELDIPEPIKNLDVGSGSHAQQTGKMMLGIEKFVQNQSPDMLLVFGDTNSTLAAALVAIREGIPLAHVEAGLRSFNRNMPEEINRIVVDRFADLLFAPTETAHTQLMTEGFPAARVHFVGDLMVDAVRTQAQRAAQRSSVLKTLGIKKKNFILGTFHRQENTDETERLQIILDAFQDLGKDEIVVLPLHPRTRKRLDSLGLDPEAIKHLLVTEPQGYMDTLELLSNAKLLLTDSGGMQKEAFALGLPCVTLRGESEWVELIEAGVNKLAEPTSKQEILSAASEMMGVTFDPAGYSFYGKGRAAEEICATLAHFLRVT